MDFTRDGYFKKLEENNYQQELDCVNTLNGTKWRINEPVLTVMRQCWDSGQAWEGIPQKDNLPLPAYPFDVEPKELSDDQQDEFKAWKGQRAEIHKENSKTISKRLQFEATLKLAEEYLQYDEFFFQWSLDFRTRKYPRENFLNPQVADFGKSLITFAVGMEITCPEEATWLAIHGANEFGVDKSSLVERELWALAHTKDALAVAENPLGYLWWQEADKPWAALAWCFEWAAYTIAVGEGETFITTLPCQVDGSCNGIQHLSAMTLDKRGGESVNLLPSDKPKDIYQDVADVATVTLQQAAQDGCEISTMLLEVGICRSIAKKPVMIVPYSGTKSTCRDGVQAALAKKCKGTLPWGKDLEFRAAAIANDHIWDAINQVITGAKEVMSYITSIASLYGDHNILMDWVTPTGFLVQQRYFKKSSQQLETWLDNRKVRLKVEEDTQTVDRKRYKSSSSPNLVHSMDASALTMTVNRCYADGIEEFAMIHDSFGTHSPNMDALNKHIREAFVALYQDNDILGNLYSKALADLPTGVDVPVPPTKGGLDLQQVLTSDYFFA